jgi:hypothetical protein
MQIAVTHTINSVLPKIEGFTSRQAPFAIAKALTRTAMRAKDNANSATKQYFDKPVTFTQRAFRFKAANKTDLEALVFAQDLQARYLRFGIGGGTRRVKGFEKKFAAGADGDVNSGALIPTRNIKLNSAGNVPLATIKRIQSQPKKYLVGKPAGGNRPPGIYERMTRAGKLKPLMIFTQLPKYRKRLPLEDIAAKTVKRHFAAELEKAYREAMRTAR